MAAIPSWYRAPAATAELINAVHDWDGGVISLWERLSRARSKR